MVKSAADDNATGGRRKLHLEDPPSRKRSEVQVYMSLFYDMRIRETVKQRWSETGIQNMDFSRTELPEDEIDPEESSIFKDTKIPLAYKNQIAHELYEAEDEGIKQVVRLTREAEHLMKTVHNTDGADRLELIQEYQRCVAVLAAAFSSYLLTDCLGILPR